MSAAVGGIAVIGIFVRAVDVIDIAVAVIVDPVARRLTGVDPHVGREIFVRVAHTGVDHRDNNAVRIAVRIPGRLGTNVLVELHRVVEVPEVVVTRIVRRGYRADQQVRLGVFGVRRRGFAALDGRRHGTQRDRHGNQPSHRGERLLRGDSSELRGNFRRGRHARSLGELDDDFVGHHLACHA